MIDEVIGIGCDWGTTSLRAYLLGRDAQIIEKIEAQKGIMSVKDGDFEKVFEEIVGTWMDVYPTCPIVLSGMIGSRQGWLEAPYIECPAQLNQLAKKLTVINLIRKRKVFLVPGLTFKDEEGIPDVMRGEEIQILGSSSTADQKEQLICLPGSHSKWVRVSCGNVIAFSTYMTGETYEAVEAPSASSTCTTYNYYSALMRNSAKNRIAVEVAVIRMCSSTVSRLMAA